MILFTFFLREIQQTLVDIGDKDPAFIGSREWIGAIELSFVLDKLLGVSILLLFQKIMIDRMLRHLINISYECTRWNITVKSCLNFVNYALGTRIRC